MVELLGDDSEEDEGLQLALEGEIQGCLSCPGVLHAGVL